MPAPVRFDDTRGAWIVARFADVRDALRDPALTPGGPSAAATGARGDVRAAVGDTARLATAPAVPALADAAGEALAALRRGATVDLARDVARAWAQSLAAALLALPPAIVRRGEADARTLFLAAATATGDAPTHATGDAATRLHTRLAAAGAATAGTVQAFVALTQTVPGCLAKVWHTLLAHPTQLASLRRRGVSPAAAAELLRYAGPTQALFRRAHADTRVGGATVARGDRLVLLLADANRDPARFPDPDRLDLARPAGAHLAYGAGPSRCAAAALVTRLLITGTEQLLTACPSLALATTPGVRWAGGYAIRVPDRVPAARAPAAVRRPAPAATAAGPASASLASDTPDP